ncbi:MAG: hypothetical protein VW440_06975 [Bordetella sp.]
MAFQLARGIDGEYCPESYFWALERGFDLSPKIKGSRRRQAYRNKILEGNVEDAMAILAAEPQNTDQRQQIGAIHPSLMGGEYLPDRVPEEVEVARITIASTTWDVTCVYALRSEMGILLRVVDEYNGQTLSGPDHVMIQKPLTLDAFMKFFFTGWDLLACLEHNYGDYGYPEDEVHDFVVEASSDFYGQFGDATRQYIDWWLDQVSPDRRA